MWAEQGVGVVNLVSFETRTCIELVIRLFAAAAAAAAAPAAAYCVLTFPFLAPVLRKCDE